MNTDCHSEAEMRTTSNDMIERNSIFGWIALGIGFLLLIPLVAMQLTNEVQWDSTDFAVMAVMLFAFASLFVFFARLIPRKRRIAAGIVILLAFIYLWAELAVGIFTDWGS